MDHPLKSGEVIIGHAIHGDVSSQVSILGHKYIISGRLDLTQLSGDQTIFMQLGDPYSLAAEDGILPRSAPRISPGDINALLIRDSKGEDTSAVTARIRREISSSYPSGYISVIGRHYLRPHI